MGGSIHSIRDVAEKQLCAGCGVCAYLAPDAIRMVDDLDRGRRPIVADGGEHAPALAEALDACPGVGLRHRDSPPTGVLPEMLSEWGPVLEVWEGYAADGELRFAASSGGAASALALFGIEQQSMHGLLHIVARPDFPWLNHTVLSTTRAEILAATGSRYAPASPCDRLDEIERAPAPCVFIGKPCDVAAANAARAKRPALDRNLAITIAIFCAGTPSTRATLAMMKRMGVDDPADLASVRYRGNGWPGNARTESKSGAAGEETYADSWAELQKHRQWRCYVCADHTGEFADIAVGDPWYRKPGAGDPGQSLIVARTERGRKFLAAAIEAGALTAEQRDGATLIASQPNILTGRGAIWGRILTTRLLGAASPRYQRMPMFPTWWRELTWREKLSSISGTARRVFRKKLRERIPVREWKP